ncbi:MAG: hypothetical protein IBX63_11615, partial [Coriobacteriia bacterium]|nr:hypothetical protein [Coriobacteriia bacterium]
VKAMDAGGLETTLREFGLTAKIDRGELKCKYCRQPVSREMVYAVFRESGAIKVVCSDPTCIGKLLEKWES